MFINKIILVFLIILVSSLTAFAVPSSIQFQGLLKDSSGAVVTAEVQMTFKIYSSSIGGNASWTEIQNPVTVEAGLYSVELGSVTPLTNSVFDGTNKYLGITVGSGVTELSPLIPIVSVPYAISAGDINGETNFIKLNDSVATTAGFAVMIGSTDTSGIGIYGSGEVNGISGSANIGTGMLGISTTGVGVKGYSASGNGLYGETGGASSNGVYGVSGGYSGYFEGGMGIFIRGPITTVTTTKLLADDGYTITNSDNVIFFDLTGHIGGSAATINLPQASSSIIGRTYYVYAVDLALAWYLGITAQAGDTVNGGADYQMTTQWGCVRVTCIGPNSWVANEI